MPRKSFAKLLFAVIMVEFFLTFFVVFLNGGKDDWLANAILSSVFLVPLIPLCLVWWKFPKGSWRKSLMCSWGILIIFFTALIMWLIGAYSRASSIIQSADVNMLEDSIALFGVAVGCASILFFMYMVPVGTIYWLTRNNYPQFEKSQTDETKQRSGHAEKNVSQMDHGDRNA